jgi:hypothetical protein
MPDVDLRLGRENRSGDVVNPASIIHAFARSGLPKMDQSTLFMETRFFRRREHETPQKQTEEPSNPFLQNKKLVRSRDMTGAERSGAEHFTVGNQTRNKTPSIVRPEMAVGSESDRIRSDPKASSPRS